MCTELGGDGMIRRRLLSELGMEEDEVKEWKVLLDKTVEDNSILYYTAEAQGCKEFYVSVFFANDEEITSAINGCIALNVSGSPWGYGIRVSGNISCLAYSSTGNNNKAIALGFEVANGIIIPTRMYMSSNNAASSNIIINSNSTTSFAIIRSSDNNSLSYAMVDEVQNVSLGSYTKYFGVGSKILILGR